MGSDPGTSVELGAFEPATADAVVEVLRRRGVPAWITGGALGAPRGRAGDELTVLVPGDRREEAFVVLTANMEEVSSLTRAAADEQALPVITDEDDEHWAASRPIVMERIRRTGIGVAMVLAPLLVITLAAPRLPLSYAAALLIAGMVALVAWRSRAGGDR